MRLLPKEPPHAPTPRRRRTLCALAAWALALLAASPAARATPPDAALHGTWTVVAVDTYLPDGTRHPAFGPQPQGYLIYTPEGTMSVTLAAGERPPFAHPQPRQGSLAEKASVADSFSAYAGRYSVDAATHTVVHHLHIASFPNWQGSDQVRRYQLDGDILTLSTPEPVAGTTSVLRFRRAR